MLRKPKVVYAGTTWTATIAARPWVPASIAAAGSGREVATSGVPEAWTSRRDELLAIRIRFMESEWAAVRAWLVWAQDTAGTFEFFPDANSVTSHTCYLESPANGEEIRLERGDFNGSYELALTLRRSAAATPILTAYF